MNRRLLTSPEVGTRCQKYPANAIQDFFPLFLFFFFFLLYRFLAHCGREEGEATRAGSKPLGDFSANHPLGALTREVHRFVFRCYCVLLWCWPVSIREGPRVPPSHLQSSNLFPKYPDEQVCVCLSLENKAGLVESFFLCVVDVFLSFLHQLLTSRSHR